jgi:hypothetical protein
MFGLTKTLKSNMPAYNQNTLYYKFESALYLEAFEHVYFHLVHDKIFTMYKHAALVSPNYGPFSLGALLFESTPCQEVFM